MTKRISAHGGLSNAPEPLRIVKPEVDLRLSGVVISEI